MSKLKRVFTVTVKELSNGWIVGVGKDNLSYRFFDDIAFCLDEARVLLEKQYYNKTIPPKGNK